MHGITIHGTFETERIIAPRLGRKVGSNRGSSDVELDFRLDVNVPVWAPRKREKQRLSPMRKSLRGNRRNSSLVNLRSDSVNGWHLSAFYLAEAMYILRVLPSSNCQLYRHTGEIHLGKESTWNSHVELSREQFSTLQMH